MKMFNLFIRELPICKFPFRWMVGMLLMYCCTGLSAQTTVTFNYTGSMQTWTVPPNVFSVEVQAWGAQGGQGETPQAVGGKGGKATGDLAVTPGQALNIFVGGQGQTTSDFSVSGGGWNGGGNARGLPEAPRGGGGGASDVRVGGTTLSNRVIVAGGGGGACTNATRGGAGGGTSGAGGENSGSGTEGDQSSGGSPSTGVACGDGSFGNGGWSSSTNACAGGGGGWYGGGADCGAGGGSGYIGGVSNGQQMVGENFGNGSVWITYYDFPNDICPDPIEIICSQTISGSTVGAGVDNPACSTNGNPGGGLWYSFIGTGQNVTVTTDLPGTDYDTYLSVFTGLCSEIICIGEDDNGGGGNTSEVSFFAASGGFYRILVNGANGEEGNFELTVVCGNPCEDAILLPCGETLIGTTDNDVPVFGMGCATRDATNTAWYRFYGTGGCVTISTCGPFNTINTNLSLFAGTCGDLTCVASNLTDSGCFAQGGATIENFPTEVGVPYYALVNSGPPGQSGDFSISLTCDFGGPSAMTCPPDIFLECGEALPPVPTTLQEFLDQGGTADLGACTNADYSFERFVNGGDFCDEFTGGILQQRIFYIRNNLTGDEVSCVQTIHCPNVAPLGFTNLPDTNLECDDPLPPVATSIQELINQGGELLGLGSCEYYNLAVFDEGFFTSTGCGPAGTHTRIYTVRNIVTGDQVLVQHLIHVATPPPPTITPAPPITVSRLSEFNNLEAEDLVEVTFTNASCEVPYILQLELGNFDCATQTRAAEVTYFDDCGRDAVIPVAINLEIILEIECPEDRTVECFDDIMIVAGEATVTNSYSNLDNAIIARPPELIQGVHGQAGAVYQVEFVTEYFFFDACLETANCFQQYTIQNDGLQVGCPPDRMVECKEDIVAELGNVTVTTPCDESYSITANDPILVSGADNCPGAQYEITYTVIAENNLTEQCVQTFTIEDNEFSISCGPVFYPVVDCIDNFQPGSIISIISIGCTFGFTPEVVGPTLIQGLPDVTGAVYEYEYTLTNTCGQTATCSWNVTIENDGIQLECPADRTVACAADILATPNEVQVDTPCGENYDVQASAPTLVQGLPDCPGAQYAITYTVTAGNQPPVECTQIFTLEGNELQVTCPMPVEQIVACAADIIPAPIDVTSTCAVTYDLVVNGPTLLSGVHNVNDARYELHYLVSNACGQTASCTQYFTIENDGLQATFPDDEQVLCVEDIQANPNGVLVETPCGEAYTISASDPQLVQGTPECPGAVYEIIYTVTTENNQMVSGMQQFTLQDQELQITCPAPMEQVVRCAADIQAGQASVTGTCTDYTIDITGPTLIAGVENVNGARYEIAYTATNACGQIATCAQYFTIENEGLQASFPEDQLVTCLEEVQANLEEVHVQTPCDEDYTISASDPQLLQGTPDCPEAVYAITYTVTTVHGQTITGTQHFTLGESGLQISCPGNSQEVVSCFEDIQLQAEEVQVTSHCAGAYTMEVAGPTLIEGTANCNGAQYELVYTATNTCGEVVSCSKRFTIENDGLTLVKNHPYLQDIAHNSTVEIQCQGQCEGHGEQWTIPQLDESAFSAFTSCSEAANVRYEFRDLGAAFCHEEGYLHRYQYQWTANDHCGNEEVFSFTIEIIDRIAPVIHNVPADVQIDCSMPMPALPQVEATDECLCAHLDFREEELVDGDCYGNRTIKRTWIAEDHCGNISEVSQLITIVDNVPPSLHLEGNGLPVSNGEIVQVSCEESWYLDWLYSLTAQSITVIEGCSPAVTIDFLMEEEHQTSCVNLGHLAHYTPTWIVEDGCGNVARFHFTVEVLDMQAPALEVSDVLYICPGEEVGFATIGSDCSATQLDYTDEVMADCPFATERTYTASDACGNTTEATQVVVDLSQMPDLIAWKADTDLPVMAYECDGNAGQYTSFDASAVQPVYPCLGSLDIAFAEILVPNSCEAGGGKLKLQWTASTACGYTDTLEYVVDIIDNTPPYFLDYEPTLTLACGEAIPTLNASDNCGAVSLDIATETISGTCGHEETLYRTITATDACGLATTVNQTIHFVDTAGPQFELPNTTCQAAATTAVQAYDACMGANIAATLMSEEVVEVCSAYQLTERVWSATDDCGNTTNFVQHIYPDDFEVEYVVINPTLQMLIANGQSSISLSDETLMDALQAIDKLAVAGLDPCGRTLESSFEQHYLPMDDCEDGVVATMTYTWNFLALCGNTFAYHLYFEVVQDEIPAIDIAEELSIYCTTDLPELEILNQADGIDYTIQTEDFRNTDGDGIVLRTITATDICGNTAAAEQTIYAYNTTDLSCAIEGYFEPSCNSKNNVYAVAIDGGTAPYDVHWEVIGTGCIVAASYGNTAEIHIGFGLARIAAKVTDANGCVTTCEATVECQGIGQLHQLANDESEIETTTFRAFPNPFRETFTVVTDAPFNETAQLMIFNSLGQVVHQQVLYDPSTIIDASALPAGTYHVILEEQGRKQRVPIVKVEY